MRKILKQSQQYIKNYSNRNKGLLSRRKEFSYVRNNLEQLANRKQQEKFSSHIHT